MFLFIKKYGMLKIAAMNLNTSYVLIYPLCILPELWTTVNLNTSYVLIYLYYGLLLISCKTAFKYILCSYLSILICTVFFPSINLNTSYVLIYLKEMVKILGGIFDLNTSYVLIYQEERILFSLLQLFKYILCSYLSPPCAQTSCNSAYLNTSYVLIYLCSMCSRQFCGTI